MAVNANGTQLLCESIDSGPIRWWLTLYLYIVAESGRIPASKHQIQLWRMSRLTRDRTTKPPFRNQSLRRERGQGNTNFPRPVDYEQHWQEDPLDPYSVVSADNTFTHIYIPGNSQP